MAVDLKIVKDLVRLGSVCPSRQMDVDDLPGDWRVEFEERAAIKEYHGGLPRERAEAQALAEVVRLMGEDESGTPEK